MLVGSVFVHVQVFPILSTHTCTYASSDLHTNRIITHRGLTERAVNGSAGVVRFDQNLGLTYDMVSMDCDQHVTHHHVLPHHRHSKSATTTRSP